MRALDEISLRLTGGQFVSVVGPSGAGKSTLLHLLGALDSPDSGSITFDGDEIGRLGDEQQSEFRHHRVGFVFQFFNLLPTLSAWENVAVPKLLDGVRLGKVKPDAVRLLDRVGLGHRTQHRPAELSGGEMQRVAVARALMMDPPLILADEPTGNLDSTTGASVLELLAEVAHEDGSRRLVVMVTHNSRCRGGDRSGDHVAGRSDRFRRGVGGRRVRRGSAIAAAASRLRLFSLRELAVHRRRTIASIAVMAVSAMYLVAIFGIFGSITGSVNRLADGIAGIAALEVSGITDAGFPDTIAADVAAVPGVATAAPMIRMSASTPSGPVLLLGADDSIAALGGALKDAVAGQLEEPIGVPDGVRVGPGVGHAKGEKFQLGSGLVTVAAVLEGKQLADLNGGHYVLAPLPLAQNVTGRQGQLDSILITTEPGADLATVRDAVTAAVNGRAIVADPSHAGNSGRRRCQDDELHGPDGCGGCFGGRRVPDLHHDDHGDQPAPAGHLDAARDRRPTRHHRSRHARGGGGSRTDRRSHRVGASEYFMGRMAIGRLPPAVTQGLEARVEYWLPGYAIPAALAATVLTSVVASAMAARQVYKVSPIEALAPVGVSAADFVPRWLRIASGVGARRGVRGIDPDRRQPKRHLRFCRDVCFVLCPDRAWLRARRCPSSKPRPRLRECSDRSGHSRRRRSSVRRGECGPP